MYFIELGKEYVINLSHLIYVKYFYCDNERLFIVKAVFDHGNWINICSSSSEIEAKATYDKIKAILNKRNDATNCKLSSDE